MSQPPRAHDDAHRARWHVDLSRPSDRRGVAALVIAGLLVLLIWSPGIGGHAPGDPAAVASDPRLGWCGGTVSDAEYAFVIPRARDYRVYLPAMTPASELNLDRQALVVVFRGAFPGVEPGQPSAAASPTARNVCIYVGTDSAGELNYYGNVSIAGLRATVNGPVLVPAAQT